MNTLIACPVCFGQSDAPMALATNMGIWMMLGVVGVVLVSFASFFIYLNRRAKLVAAQEAAGSGLAESGHHDGPPRGGHYVPLPSNPQEGTA